MTQEPTTTNHHSDPYSGTAPSAQEFMDAVVEFQQSADPDIAALREATSEIMDKIEDNE